MREAVVLSDEKIEVVQKYLPSNYEAFERHPGLIVIFGKDMYGWTLDGYVLPRLASGLIAARELV